MYLFPQLKKIMKMNRQYLAKYSFILLCLILFSCERRSNEEKLVIGTNSSLILGNNNPVFVQRNSNVWETLTCLDEDLNPKPAIAESWKSEKNGKRWTLSISKNKYFHNGDLLTPQHIVENLYRFKKHPELDLYGVYTHLDTAYAENRNVILEFRKACIDYPRKVGHYFAGIFHPKSFDEKGRVTNPIATGNYYLADYRIGKYELVKRFEGYSGEKPEIAEIEFRVISDPVIRLLALARGDIDLIAHQGGVQSYHLDFIKKYPEIRIDSFALGITHYLLFNANSRFFKQKENRVSLDALISRQELVYKVLQYKGYPAYDYFIPTKNLWMKPRFNLESDSKKVVFKNISDEEIIILLNQGDVSGWGFRLVAEYISNLMTRYHINTKIKIVEGGAYRKLINKGEYDITLYPLSIPTGTPELFLKNLVYSKGLSARNQSNLTHINDQRLDSLIEMAVYAKDEDEQQAYYSEILDKIAKDCLILPLFHEKYYLAHKSNIKNINLDPFVKMNLSMLKRVK